MAPRIDLTALVQGDRSAWDRFVGDNTRIVHAAVQPLLAGTGLEVADLVQDVFVKLCRDDYRLLRSYDPARAGLSTWLTLVARSTALDALRRRRPPSVPIDDVPESALAAPVSEPQPEGLPGLPPDTLSPRQALILSLMYERDLDPAEIARELGVTAQTVRSMHHKALTKLRALFGSRRG